MKFLRNLGMAHSSKMALNVNQTTLHYITEVSHLQVSEWLKKYALLADSNILT